MERLILLIILMDWIVLLIRNSVFVTRGKANILRATWWKFHWVAFLIFRKVGSVLRWCFLLNNHSFYLYCRNAKVQTAPSAYVLFLKTTRSIFIVETRKSRQPPPLSYVTVIIREAHRIMAMTRLCSGTTRRLFRSCNWTYLSKSQSWYLNFKLRKLKISIFHVP